MTNSIALSTDSVGNARRNEFAPSPPPPKCDAYHKKEMSSRDVLGILNGRDLFSAPRSASETLAERAAPQQRNTFSRHLTHAAPRPPRAVSAWRNPADDPDGRGFYSIATPPQKSAAVRRAQGIWASRTRSGTGPGLPHQRRGDAAINWAAVGVLAGLTVFWSGVLALVWRLV